MSHQKRIEAPQWHEVLEGKPRAVHDALRLLYNAANLALDLVDRRRLVWQDVPYASGLFGASAGTWTVASADLTSYRYLWADFLLIVEFLIVNSSTSSGMGTELHLDLPRNLSARSANYTGTLITAGNISEVGYISTRSATPEQLSLHRAAGSSWPSSVTDDLDLRGVIALEVG